MGGQERKIKRGMPFPPGLNERPLPQDGSVTTDQTVLDLEILWFLLRLEPDLGRDIQDKAINSFFDNLSLETEKWLLSDDPKFRKPRAVLVKERAIQLAQRKDSLLVNDPKNAERVGVLKSLIIKAKKSG